MSPNLEQELLQRFPQFFPADSEHFGIGCSDGWFSILDALLATIDGHQKFLHNRNTSYAQFLEKIKNNEPVPEWVKKEYAARKLAPAEVPPVHIQQIKEKFGTLRFYYQGGDSFVDGAVQYAELLSGSICEECGCPGTARTDGWVKTLCTKHHEQRMEQRKGTLV